MSYNSLHLISFPGKGFTLCPITFNQITMKACLHRSNIVQIFLSNIQKGLSVNFRMFKLT